MIKKIFPQVAGVLIILLFTYAFVTRILDFQTFTKQIENQPLPNSWTPVLTHAILAIELVDVLLLIFPRTHKVGFWLAAAFLALFIIYTILILAGAFAYIPCTCGGLVNWFGWWGHLALTLTFGAIAVIGAQLEGRIAKK